MKNSDDRNNYGEVDIVQTKNVIKEIDGNFGNFG